jgi:hypothetical protein
LRVIIAEGKFQGVTAATTPIGSRQMRRDALDIDAFGLLGEPLDEARRIDDLALGLGERLALLERHQQREVGPREGHQLVPAAQAHRALLRHQLAPGREGRGRRRDRGFGLGGPERRHDAEAGAGRRIGDVEHLAVRGRGPLAADVSLLAEQAGILEARKGATGSQFSQHVHPSVQAASARQVSAGV